MGGRCQGSRRSQGPRLSGTLGMVTLASLRGRPVLQARTRVRRFAQQNKKERLTSLLHHVNEASLGKAYLGLKRHAAPGEDG